MSKFIRYFLFVLSSTVVSCHSNYKKQIETDKLLYIDSLVASEELIYKNPDSLIQVVSTYQITEKDSLFWYYCESHKSKAYYYNYQVDSAIACCNRVEHFVQRSQPSSFLSFISALNANSRGVFLQAINERDSALTCFIKAYQSISNSYYRSSLPDICINAADVCRQLGRLPESTSWYRMALFAADSLDNQRVKHSIFSGLGQVYTDLENYSLAQSYFSMADSLYPSESIYEQFNFQNSRGNSYFFNKQYDEALQCFWKAHSITKSIKHGSLGAIVEANLGEVNLMKGELDSARFYLDQSYEYFLKDEAADDAILFYLHGLYASLGLAENNLNEANLYLSKPFDENRIGAHYLFAYHKRLMEYYKKHGDYAKALYYQDKVKLYDDSIRSLNQRLRMEDVEFRYRQDTTLLKRDIMVTQSEIEVSRLRMTLIIVLLLLLIILVLVVLVYHTIRSRHERQRHQQLEVITRLRMENVRNRFSPHFIFNVLNIVIASLKQQEGTVLPLKLLVKVLRTNLQICDKLAIELKDEIELTRDYIELRTSLNHNTPKVEWVINKDMNQHILLPAMILQIPVENAIKHAFPSDYIADAPLVKVIINDVNKQYCAILIQDNGVGYGVSRRKTIDNNKTGTGTGVRTLYRTIDLLNRYNQTKIKFDVKDISVLQPTQHGTVVEIHIPYSYNYEV